MPTYEYKCEDCGEQFEVVQKMSEEPLKHCPACNKETLKKIISGGGGFTLKGGGWYKPGFKG